MNFISAVCVQLLEGNVFCILYDYTFRVMFVHVRILALISPKAGYPDCVMSTVLSIIIRNCSLLKIICCQPKTQKLNAWKISHTKILRYSIFVVQSITFKLWEREK